MRAAAFFGTVAVSSAALTSKPERRTQQASPQRRKLKDRGNVIVGDTVRWTERMAMREKSERERERVSFVISSSDTSMVHVRGGEHLKTK